MRVTTESGAEGDGAMKLDDIINALPDGQWEHDPDEGYDEAWGMAVTSNDELVAATDRFYDPDGSVARFIAAFDPEHIRLMEDERRLARELLSDIFFSTEYILNYRRACAATDAYRKERGIE